MDKNISTESCASDSNNNLLQRMESSFQQFQEMIDEAKALNEKYLHGTTHPVNVVVEKRGSLENLQIEDSSDSDKKPKRNEYLVSRQTNDSSSCLNAKEKEAGDNDAFDEVSASDKGGHKENKGLLEEIHESNEENFKSTYTNEETRGKGRTVTSGDKIEFSSPLTSNQENRTDIGIQLSSKEMLDKERVQLQSYYDDSPRPLSVIPEETCVSEDDLSEGVLEEDDRNFERPVMAVYKDDKDFESSPSRHITQTEDYFTEIVRHGDKESVYMKSLEDSPDMQLFSGQNISNYSELSYRSPNYIPQRSYSSTPDGSEEGQQSQKLHPNPSDLIKHKPDNRSLENVFPGGMITSAEISRKFGSHVDLPLTMKRSSDEPSNTSVPSDDVILSGLSSLSLSQTDQSSTSGLSLQDAFRKSRPEFFRHSEERALRVKEARYRHTPEENNHGTCKDNHDKTPEIRKHKTPETSASKPGPEKMGGKKSGKCIHSFDTCMVISFAR